MFPCGPLAQRAHSWPMDLTKDRISTYDLMDEAHRKLAVALQNVEQESRALVTGHGSIDVLKAFLVAVDGARLDLRIALAGAELMRSSARIRTEEALDRAA